MKKILTSIILFLIFWGCEDGPTLINPPTNIDFGRSYTDTLVAVADTFIVTGKVYNGASTKLLLGEYKNFTARFLLKFAIPADTADYEIEAANLLLKANSNFGSASASFFANIYLVQEVWTDSVNMNSDWNSFLDKIDPSVLTTFELSSSDTIFPIDLPVSVIESWQDTTDGIENYGLLFDYTAANFIKEFSSLEDGSDRPKLILSKRFSEDSTAIDTIALSSATGLDASLVNYEGDLFEQNSTNRYICAGYAVHSFIKFNFDVIPSNALLSSANFILIMDPETSSINENRSLYLEIKNVISDYEDLQQGNFQFDTTYNYELYVSQQHDNMLSMGADMQKSNCINSIQRIINKDTENGSFYFEHYKEEMDISLIGIRGANDPDENVKPKLIITYYLHDKTRM